MINWKGDITIPIVSVSCLTYNHEKYIDDAINGLLIQDTNFPIEILIHDDASNDNTAEIIRRYQTLYPNIIKPIYQTENQYSKDKGVIRKIQYGRAHGKYIAYCEGDDYWTDPSKLQKQVDFLESHLEYVACFHYTDTVNEDNEIMKMSGDKSMVCYIGDYISAIQGCFGKGSTLSVVFRSNKISINELNELNKDCKIGDWPLFLYLSLKGKAYTLPEAMGVYRNHNAGVTKIINHLDFFQTRILVMHRIEKYISDTENIKILKSYQHRVYFRKLNWLILSGNWHLLIKTLIPLIKAKKELKLIDGYKHDIKWVPEFDLDIMKKNIIKTIVIGFKNFIVRSHRIDEDPLYLNNK
ncbi:MAG: glycosyltransferase [Chlorobiaceae bacterium]|nr:glycosyltransferase [Chlorobiaceae bacterium]